MVLKVVWKTEYEVGEDVAVVIRQNTRMISSSL